MPDAGPAAVASLFPEEWGACNSLSEQEFGSGATVELVECDIDPPAQDEEARPRNYAAHLVLRHDDDAVAADEELGQFVKWEEGTNWSFAGVLVAPNGTHAALPLYSSGSMGPDSGSLTLHAYALERDHWSDIFQIGGGQLEIEVAKDHTSATLHICDGSCEADPDQATHRDVELRYDGKQIIAK